VQKIITVEKGVALDFDSVSRDAKSQSKELYTWGQNDDEDIKDVTDRLAYLNFVQGSLASSLANKLDAARTPLKALRDAETALAPRRNIRTNLKTQLARLEHESAKGFEKRIAELKEQIRKAEFDDQDQENEVEILKRKGVRESEQLKWEAIREYGEKLVLLSQAATPIITALPSLPPTPANPYSGSQVTAAARASLQRALDNYKTGHINLPPQSAGSDLSRSDTRSFGESHASELSSMTAPATQPGIPMTPPVGPVDGNTASSVSIPSTSKSPDFPDSFSPPVKSQSPPINPSHLNLSPAPIPASSSSSSATGVPLSGSPAVLSPDPVKPTVDTTLPPITPTVAETGVPVTAGAEGPGPASGSLRDIKAASASAGPRSGGLPGNEPAAPYGQSPTSASTGTGPQKFETAEEEKKRLAAQYSQAHSQQRPQPEGRGPAYESAEEEKKRLEREERERLLRQGGSGSTSANDNETEDPKEELPPYQDY